MKEHISIRARYVYALLAIFALVILSVAAFLIIGSSKYKSQLKLLQQNEIAGKIVQLKHVGRGFCDLKIVNSQKIISQYSLEVSWEIKTYGIHVGDSIAKGSNSPIVTFYTIKDDRFVKVCEHNIRP